MNSSELHTYLKEYCKGKEHVVSGRSLSGRMHLSENELRRKINQLRRAGIPIASSRNGYYYAQTAGDVYATIRSLRKLEAGLDAAIAGLERSLEQFGGDAG